MSGLEIFIWIVQAVCAVLMVVLILLQHGKGADMGVSLGTGSAGSLFGPTGGVTFLSRATAILAAIFFASTFLLVYLGNNPAKENGASVLEKTANTPSQSPRSAPSAPAPQAPVNQIPGV
jgi:preprotein translocase subunit SecG